MSKVGFYGRFSSAFEEIFDRMSWKKIETVRTPEDPDPGSGFAKMDSGDHVPGEFSGFRAVNRRCPPRPSSATLSQSVCLAAFSDELFNSEVLDGVRNTYFIM